MSGRDGQAADGGDVAGEGELERARGEVPDFDDAVAGAGGEPGVARLDGDAADPAEVARDDADELPGGVVRRLYGARRLVEGEGVGELGRGGKGGGLGRGGVVDGGDHARGRGSVARREQLLGGRAGGALLGEERGGEGAVVGVFVGDFDGEAEAGAVRGERGTRGGCATDLCSSGLSSSGHEAKMSRVRRALSLSSGSSDIAESKWISFFGSATAGWVCRCLAIRRPCPARRERQ